MSKWLRYYAFDVLGEIFFGKEGGFGMVRDDVDYNGWCNTISTIPNIGASVSYLPYGFRTAWMIAEVLFGGKQARDGVSGISKFVVDAKAAAIDRVKQREADPKVKAKQDMLSKLIDVAETPGGVANWNMNDVTVRRRNRSVANNSALLIRA
jgi:hypothetical protein